MRKVLSLVLALMLALGCFAAMAEADQIVIGVVYKQTGNPFFEAAVRGFEEAAAELGFAIIHNGPADSSNEGQIQIIEGFIQAEVDAIAVSANDAAGLVNVLKKAMEKGIKVVSTSAAYRLKKLPSRSATKARSRSSPPAPPWTTRTPGLSS